MTEPLTGARLPFDSDAPLGGTQISRAITDLASFTNPRFDSSAARDAAYSAFVARGGVMKDGMQCAVGSVQYARAGGTWQVMWTPASGAVANWVTFAASAAGSGWAFENMPGGSIPSSYKREPGRLSVRAALRRTGGDLAAPAADGNITDTPLIDEAIAAMATGHNHYQSGQGPHGFAVCGVRLNASGTVDLTSLANDGVRLQKDDLVVFDFTLEV